MRRLVWAGLLLAAVGVALWASLPPPGVCALYLTQADGQMVKIQDCETTWTRWQQVWGQPVRFDCGMPAHLDAEVMVMCNSPVGETPE